jgi:hypothetical protein
MYQMLKEMVVPMADLQFMTIECSVCHTSVALNMRQEVATGQEFVAAGGTTPRQWPFCRAPYDVNADTVNAFRAFYRNRIDRQTKISFLVKDVSAGA